MFITRTMVVCITIASGFFAPGFLFADWREDIGTTRLVETFGNVPTAVGLVTQVEASDATGNNYLPDASNSAFAGKTIANRSLGFGVSGHATGVGGFFYGKTGSLLPATTQIHAYNANGWLQDDALHFGDAVPPLVETAHLQNHSWIAATGLAATHIANIGQRLDHAIHRDGFVSVAGVNNGASTTLPQLLAQAYNHITVGLTNGHHSAGFTVHDGAGRIKPDLVSPDSVTSNATPQVVSAAGVLLARSMQSPHSLTGADLPRVVKALLLAGATKEEFATWARTTARPLDLRFGAGELNLLLAYRTLEAGRAIASVSALRDGTGWAAEGVSGGAQKTYFFEIPPAAAAAPFSVALTWHRLVNDGNPLPTAWSAAPVALVNLDLRLHAVAAGTFTLGAILDQSASTVDNVEHVYAPALAPGRYALVVASPSGAAATDYALAWRATSTVTLAATAPAAREFDGAAGQITVTRLGSTATPLFVPLVFGGTAVAGTHYVTPPASLLIPAGAASGTLTLTPITDALAQGDRTITLSLTGDYTFAATGPAAAATVTLSDKPYDAWRSARFSSAELADASVSGDAADPDGDGMGNLLEYALGGEPRAADSAGFTPATGLDGVADNARLTLTYTQPAARPDIAYLAEWSNDLATAWQTGAAVVTELSRTPVPGGEQVFVRATATLADAPSQFLRLRVTRQ